MTITGKYVACALWLALAIIPARAAEDEADAPARFARTLVMVQDQIVMGSSAALGSVPELRRRLATAIEHAPASVWKEPQQGRALVLHLLNGGVPQVVRKLVDNKVDFGQWRDIVHALLANAERKKGADQLLGNIDATLLDPSIAGPLALAQAISNAHEPQKAMGYLFQARLFSPGGLVEDAAMRREIEMLIAAGKEMEAAQVAARYLWRFGSSVYAKDVVEFLAGALLPEIASRPEGKVAIAALTDELPVPARIETLMKVARRAILQGSIKAADFAAGKVFELAPVGSAELSRATLYKGIAQAFSDPTGASVDKLRETNTRTLLGEDRGLLQASLLALERVRAPIDASAIVEASSSAAIEAAAQAISAARDQLDQMRP